jgi:hypothetical protein
MQLPAKFMSLLVISPSQSGPGQHTHFMEANDRTNANLQETQLNPATVRNPRSASWVSFQ